MISCDLKKKQISYSTSKQVFCLEFIRRRTKFEFQVTHNKNHCEQYE